ncbi:MAG: hypothetical protein K2N14_00125 [Clostridia bacterium]|nr:hypothetical protein [Clostridia bacterium]
MIAFGLLVFTLVMTVPLFISSIQICCRLIKKDNHMWNYRTDPYALAATAGIVGTALLIPALILLFKTYYATLIIAFALSLTGTITTAIFGLLVDARYKNR